MNHRLHQLARHGARERRRRLDVLAGRPLVDHLPVCDRDHHRGPVQEHRAAVHRQRTVEFLRLFIDGPVKVVAEVQWKAGCREHRAGEAKLFHGATKFFYGRRHVLHRNQRHRFEPRA